jgi:tetratricopeptide (TPR) repeat protein
MSHARDWASVFAQLHGRYAEAERLADEAFELSEGSQAENAAMQRLDKRFAIYREQGRLQELRPAVERFAIGAPDVVAWSALLALLDAEAGEAAWARPQVDRLVARSATAVPRDIFWLITVAALAETCAILDDAAEPGATLYRLLLPHADRCVQAGCADACWGSVSRFLALAATACEDWDAADGHFLTAARHNGQIGSAPLVARTRVDHAGMLLRQGDRTRHGEIEEFLAEATAVAEPMGMVDVCRRAKRLRAQAAGGAVLA